MDPPPVAAPFVRSVNVGRLVPSEHTSVPEGTGIDKRPVAAIEVRDPGPRPNGLGSGVVGDAIGDRRHHGGDRQAVYAFAREELDWWAATLDRDLPDGMFGENLTTSGLDVDAAVVGQRWSVGEAILEVAGPRIPCRTFAGHMGEARWVRRFTERGRTGAYLTVVTPGIIVRGAMIAVGPAPAHGITVPQVFRALTGDLSLAPGIVAARILGDADHADLVGRLERASGR